MKIVFFGTPNFAIPSLEYILASNHELLSVVTNPDKKSGRGLRKQSSPVKVFCTNRSIDSISFDDFNDVEACNYLKSLNADLFVVVAFKILPESVINIPRHGSINLHPSLLPKYRGSSPIQQSILNGDKETGVTIFKLNSKVDSGDVIIQNKCKIQDNIIFSDLYCELAKFGAEALLEAVNLIDQGEFSFLAQNKENISYAFKIEKKDCRIDWFESAHKINNKVRAFSDNPGAFTFLNSKKVKIFGSKVETLNLDKELSPSECIYADGMLFIGTGEGVLSVKNIQIEGKKNISAKDFSNSGIFNNKKSITFA